MSDGLFDALDVTRKTGGEQFTASGQSIGSDLLGFWRWAASDLVNNAMRGVLAEYIVGLALDCVEGTRVEWDAADLITAQGCRVEVKSAAYLQSWKQNDLSPISFGIMPTTGWDATTNTISVERRRQADVYVFCLLVHTNKSSVDPLNLDQWQFYVLPTSRLNAAVGDQKRISLAALRRLEPATGTFADIPRLVRDAYAIG